MSFPKQDRTDIGAGWVIVALLSVGSTAAWAGDGGGELQYLQGDYGLTTVSNCVRALPHPPSIVGLDPNTRQLLVPGEAVAQSGSGVMHFYKDGRAIFKGTASELDIDKTTTSDIPSIPGLTLDCDGTYILASGNKMTLLVTCRVGVPNAGISFEVKPVEAEGFVGSHGRSINLNQKQNVQIVTFTLPNGAELKSERVCAQRFDLSKLF